MATQHRSRRARAIQRQRVDAAEAAEDLRHADTDEATHALVAEDGFARRLVPMALWQEGWSVLEAADAIAALAMAGEMPAAGGATLGERLRERDAALLHLIGGGHSGAPRGARGNHGRAAVAGKRLVAGKPLAAGRLASSAVSIAD